MGKYYYQQEVRHIGLNKYRVVKAETRYELNQKVSALKAQWDEQWERQLEREVKRMEREEKNREREAKIKNAEESTEYAAGLTEDADQVQESLDTILQTALEVDSFEFDSLKHYEKYSESKPKQPKLKDLPTEPQSDEEKYNPKPSLMIRLSKKKMEEFTAANQKLFSMDHEEWEKEAAAVKQNNDEKLDAYNQAVERWTAEKAEYEESQNVHNKLVDELETSYQHGDAAAIEHFTSILLERVVYPFDYDRSVEAEYSQDTSNLIIDVLFPNLEDLPRLKAVSYVKSKNEFKNTFYSDSYMKKKYDSVIYQMVLQILYDVFQKVNAVEIDAVTLNGKVQTVDKATGKNIQPYILSVRVSRQDFEEINLEAVDPKTWFKSAKGVSAANIANITPVAPVVRMSKTDSRFIEGYDVVDSVDESVNLAAMDWQDFENLIREIFEQEFNTNGGEVKITQASRDGGVDAVAFDPDPIRGGKIVIQAKRYTNVVGVSAVRDLYGTVMNEGATKGILVTTSHFGNDAYSFAQGKPLTLMDGANLLYLLEKHGHKARIDIYEAKNM